MVYQYEKRITKKKKTIEEDHETVKYLKSLTKLGIGRHQSTIEFLASGSNDSRRFMTV